MGRPGRDTAKDHTPSHPEVYRFNCSDLYFGDPGGLGAPIGFGEDGSRSSPKTDAEDSSKSGNANGRFLANRTDHLRHTPADAHNPGSGDCGPDRSFSGFYPRILWLVRFD